MSQGKIKRTRRNTFTPDSPPSPMSKPYLYEIYAIPELSYPLDKAIEKDKAYVIGREYSEAVIQKAIANHIEKTNREKNIDTKTI